MSGIVTHVGELVGASVKGLMGIAEGYIASGNDDDTASLPSSSSSGPPTAQPIAIHRPASSATPTLPGTSVHASRVANGSSALVQIVDVPSGWIHLQSTYLDDSGSQKKVRSFGLKNCCDGEVEVEVDTDLDGQVLFWLGEDERASSSASSTSSSSNTPGSPSVTFSLPAQSTTVVYLSFQPTNGPPPFVPSPNLSDGGFTPRVMPTLSRTTSSEVSPVPSSSTDKSAGNSGFSDRTNHSGSTGQSVSSTRGIAPSARKLDPVHRSYSVHGSIAIRATTAGEQLAFSPQDTSVPSSQLLNLPFFATVCRSLFTAALIDPTTGLASGQQQSSGQLLIDFGSEPVVGSEFHRDVLLVNRSEIELVWMTAVVSCTSKDSVWFSLRDLDSENVFGVDRSSQPVPLPALSSRHLRLSLRVKAPIENFEFDFVVSNVHQSGNVVTCKAIGSGRAEASDDSLKILSGTNIDFGQITDGSWARKMITCKNAGERALDVHFGASDGMEVVFRLAGVAGDDMDEDVPPVLERVPTRTAEHKASSDRLGSVHRESQRGRDNSPRTVSSASSQAWTAATSSHLATSAPSATSDMYDADESQGSSGLRDVSLPPSRPLSRATSRASSSHFHTDATESEEEDGEAHFFGNNEPPPPATESAEARGPTVPDALVEKNIPNQIEEITMRPGTEYRVFVVFRPARDSTSPPEVAGALRKSAFKVFLDSSPAGKPATKTRRTISCTAESCTSLISLAESKFDFGEVTVGASKSSTLRVSNLSALSARVEIAAISKVLSANRNVIVIPPHESVEERLEFFPRRINDNYEKQIFVRNLLNRANDQLIEIRSKNVDRHNLTLHSHLYKILTPSGSNFLDFGSVVINAPSVRTVAFDNLSSTELVLELSASQPEDVALYVKAEDAPVIPVRKVGRYDHDHDHGEEPTQRAAQPNGELKERFMETMHELSNRETKTPKVPGKKAKKPEKAKEGDADKSSVGAAVAAALKKGGRGRPVQLYGNAVVFKDRTLLGDHEYLDLAAGPPIAAHRTSPRSKKTQLLDSIELEDKSKLSGQHPKIPKLDFAAGAKLHKSKAVKPRSPLLQSNVAVPTPPVLNVAAQARKKEKSPALTGKRDDPKLSLSPTSGDVSKMTVDELLIALEQHDLRKASISQSSPEEEEQFVRRTIALRKELQVLVNTKKLVPARTMSVPPGGKRNLILVMTPNGSIRPHITTRPKRADSRIFIKLLEFDHSKLSQTTTQSGAESGVHGLSRSEIAELPVRDLIIRSSCVRSILEVQQTSINFGQSEKGEPRHKTIVIQNKSDHLGLFRFRTSGSIASGDLKLGLGRYGVISAYGRREFANFSFVPSMVGEYKETLVLENVLDGWNDQTVAVKAMVRKAPTFTVEPDKLDFGEVSAAEAAGPSRGVVLTNVSKHERTFNIEIAPYAAFAQVSLSLDESHAGTALSKGEEEEVEKILQKLKIARRKGKTEKVTKYEQRLRELGVDIPAIVDGDVESEASGGAAEMDDLDQGATRSETINADADPSQSTERPSSIVITTSASTTAPLPIALPPALPVPVASLSLTLQPNQKNRIIVTLLPHHSPSQDPLVTPNTVPLSTCLRIYDRKNTDEMSVVNITASPAGAANTPSAPPLGSNTTTDALHLALMRHCLSLASRCTPSPTAFNVGSTLFLRANSPLFPNLEPHFSPFTDDHVAASTPGKVLGLILGDGFSRQIPGNTHAEANALTNFRAAYSKLAAPTPPPAQASTTGSAPASTSTTMEARPPLDLPPVEDVLSGAECYATMEPCSVRTSGGPSCALELVRAKVRAVYLGVEEPPDFVNCEGVRVLEQGGVKVWRVAGLEEECLKAARRGRS